MRFTILSTINITYNTQSTSHNNYIYIVNNTYYTYKPKSAYNVHTTYRNNAMSFSQHFFLFLLTKHYFTSNTIFTNFTLADSVQNDQARKQLLKILTKLKGKNIFI